MILEHYAEGPLIWPPHPNYVQDRVGMDGNMKPNGLWVSVPGEDDWPSWCRAEKFHLEHLAVATRVILKDDANILRIGTVAEIVAFDEKYGVEHPLSPDFSWHVIDWPRVAGDYDGIVIAPYIWPCRLPMEVGTPKAKVSNWYYGWDCASGCIWNTNCIAAFEVVKEDA